MSKIDNCHIRPQGVSYPTSPVKQMISEGNGWQLDRLEDGHYLVSNAGVGMLVSRDKVEAIGYYVDHSHIEKIHFGPLVALKKESPVLYKILYDLQNTMEDEIDDLFEAGAYWRAGKGEPQRLVRYWAAWRVVLKFARLFRENREALAREGFDYEGVMAKQIQNTVEARIRELDAEYYLEKVHFLVEVMAAHALYNLTHESA